MLFRIGNPVNTLLGLGKMVDKEVCYKNVRWGVKLKKTTSYKNNIAYFYAEELTLNEARKEKTDGK